MYSYKARHIDCGPIFKPKKADDLWLTPCRDSNKGGTQDILIESETQYSSKQFNLQRQEHKKQNKKLNMIPIESETHYSSSPLLKDKSMKNRMRNWVWCQHVAYHLLVSMSVAFLLPLAFNVVAVELVPLTFGPSTRGALCATPLWLILFLAENISNSSSAPLTDKALLKGALVLDPATVGSELGKLASFRMCTMSALSV